MVLSRLLQLQRKTMLKRSFLSFLILMMSLHPGVMAQDTEPSPTPDMPSLKARILLIDQQIKSIQSEIELLNFKRMSLSIQIQIIQAQRRQDAINKSFEKF